MPTTFTSPVPGSAVWSSGSQECRATGRAVLSDLRAGLLWEQVGPMSADAGAAAVGAAIDDAASTGWSASTLTALAALLSRYGHSAYANAVRANVSRGGPFSRETMQAALWAAYSTAARTVGSVTTNVHSGSPSSYVFDADAQLPSVGSLAPTPLDGVTEGISCSVKSNPRSTEVTQTGVAAINPALLAVLIVATAVAGVVILSAVRERHGEGW